MERLHLRDLHPVTSESWTDAIIGRRRPWGKALRAEEGIDIERRADQHDGVPASGEGLRLAAPRRPREKEETAMKELVFALEFKGSAGPVPGSSNRLRATTSATSQALRSVLKPDGVDRSIETVSGDSAAFESEVEIVGEGAFVESGTITYGKAGRITFKTVGRGVLGPSPVAGLQRGAVIWEISSGDGRLAGAQGLITSNFTVGPQGEVTDDHFVRMFLPS
jgi:hypothetical protein